MRVRRLSRWPVNSVPASSSATSGSPSWTATRWPARLRSLPETRSSVLVALTGYGQEEDKKRSLTAGFHYHLVKPVSPRSLEDLLGLESTNGDVQESVME